MTKKNIIALLLLLFNTILIAQTSKISRDSILSVINSGFKNIGIDKIDKAIYELNISLEYGKANNDNQIIKNSATGLGAAYIALDNLKKANTYYNIALNISPETITSADYNNIANLFELKKDSVSAIKYYKLSRKLCIKNKDSFKIIWPAINLALIKHNQKKYNEATFYFKEVLDNFVPNSLHQPQIFIDSNLYLAEINARDKKYNVAHSYLNKADSLSLTLNKYEELFNSEKIRYNIYNQTNQPLKAKESLQKQIEYISVSKDIQQNKLIKNSKLEQKLLDKERTLEFTTKLNNTQKETLRKTRLFTYIVLVFLGLTSIILYLLQRSNSSRKKLNDDLIAKNKVLSEAKEKTEYASKLKENFFSTISHELRTPLYAVTGITDILIDDNPKEEHIHYLKTLKSSGEHLLGLINNILQINKFDANKIEINTIDFNIRSLISNIKESLSYLKTENNNQIHIDIDEAIPSALQGDSLKIAQIIVNLLSNALKFTKNGNIWIIIKCIEKTETTVNLNIKVKDDGIGISKDMQAQIFEDFYQESMRLDRNYEGTGLGLAIVKRLLNAMGSDINVNSTPLEGSTFYFDLTLNIKQKNTVVDRKLKEHINLEGKHFLVVDDNAINLMITRRILESKNAKVTVAENGFEAIKKAKEHIFDIILMDLHMPKMNGYATTKEIKRFNTTTPVIALTAETLDNNKNKIIESGIDSIITKPFVTENFFNVIKKFL
jgi:signal transduction histidine kinase/CheY-like chemotaxis protein